MSNRRIDRVLQAAWDLWMNDEGNHMTPEWYELCRALQDARESGDLDHLKPDQRLLDDFQKGEAAQRFRKWLSK